MIKIKVETTYHFTESAFVEYIETLKKLMSPERFDTFIKKGKVTWTSEDPDGSSTTSTHEMFR